MSIEADTGRAVVAQASRPRSMQVEATAVFAILGVTAAFGSALLVTVFALPWSLMPAVLTVLALIASFALPTLHHHGHDRFGLANVVTSLRAAMTAVLAGALIVADLQVDDAALVWTLAVLAVTALLLDGLDGAIARRAGQVSDYGARYDMEIDALLILCLSAMAFMLGKAGPWILAIGLMRYGFVAAALFVPRLGATLPESLRRKAICVVQVVVLCLVVLPPVEPTLAAPLAALALALLALSFAIDIRRLLSANPGRA